MTDISTVFTEDGVNPQAVADVIVTLVNGGFTANSAKKFLQTGNVKDLRHTGKTSVQLFDPKA